MKRIKLKLTIEERRAIFHALRSYLNNAPELRPDYTHAELIERGSALMAAQTFEKLDFHHYFEGIKPVVATPAGWSAIFAALDLAYMASDSEAVRAVLRNLFSKIFPIINRSFYE